MKVRQKIIFLWLALLICISAAEKVQASHSMGSDLTYHCLGPNQYEVTLSFYRDCAGVEADTVVYIVFQSSCYGADSIPIYFIPNTGQEISPICLNEQTTCNGGTFTGIQEYVYRGVITLPGPCADWQFSYLQCCRNNAITNIQNPGQTQMYITATLDNTVISCNNSPTFSNKPVPFVCLGQQFCFNHGAYDQDGDSLVYSLMSPYDSPGNPITYNAGFSQYNPLSSSPAMSFNTQTGDICMTPTQLEVTVMAVRVFEYRNGVLIGSVERDIQITVINCSNAIPTLTGMNGTNSFAMTMCADAMSCFSIYSADADAPQSTTITWDQSIPGGIFTTYPGQRESAIFCWQPTQAQISTNPYCFTVTVSDNNCPYRGTQTYAYCITVTGVIANAGPDQSIACNGTASLTASATGGSGSYTYSWNNGTTGATTTGGAGTYVVTVSDGMCTDKDTASVAPGAGAPSAAFNMVYSCSGLSVQFQDQSIVNGSTITSWAWNFGDAGTSTLQNPTHVYAAQGNYNVTLIVTTAAGCIDTLITPLHLSLNQPAPSFTSTAACQGAPVNFSNSTGGTIATYLWKFGDGGTAIIRSPAHTYAAAGSYNVWLIVTNTDGCVDSVVHPVTVYALPAANAGNDVAVCSGSSATLTASGGGTYLWSPGSNTSATLTVTPATTTTYMVIVTNAYGCTATDQAVITVNSHPFVNAGQNQTICFGGSANLNVTAGSGGGGGHGGGGGGSGPYTYLWTPGNLNTQQITVTPGTTTQYTVIVTDANGCTNSDTVNVNVASQPLADAGPAQTICAGDSAVLTASGGNTYQWIPSGQNGQSIVVYPVVTTTYTVNVMAGGGCQDDDTVTVIVAAPLNANAGLNQTICVGASATLTATGGTTYSWSPGNLSGSSIQVTPAITTQYIVTVNSPNSCTAVDTVDVIVNPLPVADAGQDTSLCLGDTIQLAATGGNQYAWTPGGSSTQFQSVSPAANTFYTVTVTDANGCTSSDQVQVAVHSLPSASATATDALCFGAASGSATVNTSSGTAPYSYAWLPGGGNTATISNLTAGTYHVTVTDQNGCVDQDSAVVSQPSAINLSSASDSTLCNGSSDGAAHVTASGGASSFTYSWAPSGGNQPDAISLAAGSYTVTVTDANGCTNTNTVTVIQPAALVLNPSSTATLCYGDSTGTATVNVAGGTGAYSYQWSNNATTQTISAVASANYTVTVTDANGCTSTAGINVAQPSQMSATVTTTAANCNVANGTATAHPAGGSPAYTYQWTPAGGNGVTTIGVYSGPYTVRITDSNGCTLTASAAVPDIGGPVINAQLGGNVTCNGGNDGSATVNVASGTGPFTYVWTPSGGNAATANNLSAGTYSVSVADANGCASVDTVNISQPSAIQPSVTGVDVTCHGYTDGSATVVANGGTGALQYNWSPSGGNAATATALGAGTYTVTVTDANACTTTATINLSEPPAINIIMSSVPLSCYQSNDGLVSAVVNGGSGNYTYFWSPGGAVGSGISNVAAGTYIVHITDSNGCVASDTELVDQPDPIVLSTTASPVSCSGGNSGSVNVFASGGTGAFSYLWIPGNSSTALTTGLAAATYTVTATDVNGCTSTSTATVSSAVPMTLAVNTPPVICVGAPATLEATATGGATPYHFLWSNADTGSVILVSPGVTSAYSVTVYDANGCTLPPATVTVNVYPPLSVNISPADTICYGDQATVFAAASGGNGGPYSYAWNDSSFTGWTSVVEPVNDSLFVVAAYDGCSPVVHNQVQIIVNPLPQVDFIPHLLNGCTPVEVDFSNMYPQAAGSQYNWNLDDGTVSQDENPSHTYVAPGTYDVSLTITSPEGCIGTQTVEDVVTVYGFPDAAFLQSDNSVSIFTPVVTFTDNSTDAVSWQWDFGDGSTAVDIENPVHEYADTGTYMVRLIVTNQGGCVDTTYGYVYVEQEFTVYIPNAFTPNGDGVNDSFVANGIGWTAYEMWIMDRWGKELFHSTDRTYQWDGSYYSNNSTLCQNDVYEYIIKVTDYKNQSHKFIGHVTLVR